MYGCTFPHSVMNNSIFMDREGLGPDHRRFHREREKAEAHIRQSKHGELIWELAERYADVVEFPGDSDEEPGGYFRLAMEMHEAALATPRDDDEAIEKAIRARCHEIVKQQRRKG